uniref:Uncharacterized protein n=1 Tax=Eutreptiella gymnastica TaxID=73025 RepID=A0A7S4FVT5_9EUGL
MFWGLVSPPELLKNVKCVAAQIRKTLSCQNALPPLENILEKQIALIQPSPNSNEPDHPQAGDSLLKCEHVCTPGSTNRQLIQPLCPPNPNKPPPFNRPPLPFWISPLFSQLVRSCAARVSP